MVNAYLGVNRETGEKVLVPLGHLAIFGQTRRAGKTTSLREIVTQTCRETGSDAVVFRTGRNEIDFPGATELAAYYRERVDWKGVESMLWSFLGEKTKVYRTILMKAVRGARRLEDVHRNVVVAMKKERSAWARDMAFQLDNYFTEITAWLRVHPLANVLYPSPFVNVVDLEGWPPHIQQLVIAAMLEALMDEAHTRPVIVVIPEARDFIPSDRNTPVKLVADEVARRGAKLNLFLWLDSQSLTGVDQQVLRNFAYLLQGVQTSDLEVRRICKAIEGVKPAMVRSLHVGDFLLHTPDGLSTIHVPLAERQVPLAESKVEEDVDAELRKEFEEQIKGLRGNVERLNARNIELERQLKAEHARAEANAMAAAANAVKAIGTAPTLTDLEAAVRRTAATAVALGPGEHERVDLHVQRAAPNLTIHVVEKRLNATPDSHEGKLAILISEGFFEGKRSTGPIGKEYAARGWGTPTGGNSAKALRDALQQLCAWGFLRTFNGMYDVVPEAKARVRVVKEAE
jgi:hypothetical protein